MIKNKKPYLNDLNRVLSVFELYFVEMQGVEPNLYQADYQLFTKQNLKHYTIYKFNFKTTWKPNFLSSQIVIRTEVKIEIFT